MDRPEPLSGSRGWVKGLSSDQLVASAAVRFAGCSKATNSWSKGGR